MHQMDRQSYDEGEKGARVGIWTNLVLFTVKISAGVLGRSQALVVGAFHMASDNLTRIAALISFRIARKPADALHPFGHGRAESIAAKVVSLILILVALWIAYGSALILFSGNVPKPVAIALVAAVLSIFVKEVTYRWVISLSRKIHSTSLMADAYHHRSDAFSSIAALARHDRRHRLGWPFMDPLAGIIVAAFILKVGLNSFHTAYDELMDAAPERDLENRIAGIVRA